MHPDFEAGCQKFDELGKVTAYELPFDSTVDLVESFDLGKIAATILHFDSTQARS